MNVPSSDRPIVSVSRAGFLATCAGLGIADTFASALWRTAGADPARGSRLTSHESQAPKVVTREIVAAAEKLVGLSFTDAERDLMLDNLNNALQSYTQLRSLAIPNHVPPAFLFSPLLPGRPLPAAGKPPKRPKPVEVARPASDAELAFLPVTALSDLVRRKKVTPTELTGLYIARLKRHDPTLLCVVNLTEERALRQAAVADAEIQAGRYRGPLHGIPWGAKDLLSVPGYPTTWGSPLFRSQMLETTATVVERLDAAGAILVAKLSLGEFAQGDVWFGGTTKNPWKPDQGSSGSSAGPGSATAAGLVGFSIGTETLGSIVSPSTRNGVSGLRPTFGRVSRSGAMALSWTMDKIGPMCRSVADCALVFDAIHGPDGRDATVHAAPFAWDPARPLSSIRIGYLKAAFDQERPLKALDDAALEALRGLGVSPVVVEMPTGVPTGALRIILTAEAAAAFDEITRDNRDDQMVQQTASAWPNAFRAGRFIPAVEYINANRARTLLMERMERVFDQVDVFMTPSFGGTVLLTTNLTGHPAVTVPSGFRDDGTPVSISFIGKLWGEAELCRVATAWQEATGWHLRRPAVYATSGGIAIELLLRSRDRQTREIAICIGGAAAVTVARPRPTGHAKPGDACSVPGTPSSVCRLPRRQRRGPSGTCIVANLVRGGFTGPVYPVNPKATSICSVPAFASLAAVPGPIDLAVICVPKQLVYDVALEAIERGVTALVVISAGFREVGGEGVERERRLTELVRSRGVRMVGPNCMGVLNADPAVRMNATFAPSLPSFGPVAFVSQSGAIGMSVLDYAREYGIGLSQFVSVGNKPDVSGNDLLLAWEQDPAVGVILMYVENFGNPRRFLEIASRVTKVKPIIVVKSGRSRVGARAASSHTGAIAASDAAVDALLTQAGVLRARSVETLFELAMGFGAQAAPRTRRTAVVTNAGGPGILAADAAEAVGLVLPELSPETVARLRPLFPEEASIGNPLDMIASATPAGYRTALAALLDDPGVDSVLAIYVPIPPNSPVDVAEAIATAAAARVAKPVFAVVMGHEGLPQGRVELGAAGIPAYLFPESAARALMARVRHREWQDRPPTALEELPVDRAAADALMAAARKEGRRRLSESDALDLLAAYGIPVACARFVTAAADAARAADEMGYPVVVKVVAPAIVHKTEADGVQVDLRSGDDVRQAWDRIHAGAARAAPGATVEGVVVQRMVHGGRELIIGMTRDPDFGPLVMFGLGGVLVEVLRDVTFRIGPFSRLDARDMIRAIRGVKLLEGVRGAGPVDFTALEDVLLRVSQLARDFPEITELDLNPLLASEDRLVAVDARVAVDSEGRER